MNDVFYMKYTYDIHTGDNIPGQSKLSLNQTLTFTSVVRVQFNVEMIKITILIMLCINVLSIVNNNYRSFHEVQK